MLPVDTSKDKANERRVRIVKQSLVNGAMSEVGKELSLKPEVAGDLVATGRGEYVDGRNITADEAGRLPGQVDIATAATPPWLGPTGATNAPGARVVLSPANAAPQGDVNSAIQEVKDAEAPIVHRHEEGLKAITRAKQQMAATAQHAATLGTAAIPAVSSGPANPPQPGNTPAPNAASGPTIVEHKNPALPQK